jgi:solute carrier family 35 protein C2
MHEMANSATAMCKSSVLGFVLLFAILFGLEKPSWKLGAIIGTMSVGVFLMVTGEAQFHALGFAHVMSSAASSGFRWSLTQILLVRHAATANPFASIFFLAPCMFATLLVLAVLVEGLPSLLAALGALSDARGGPVVAAAILLFPGALAFAMTASEFALLQRTSVVTLSICGILKEVLTITAASVAFHDRISAVNGLGLVITVATIAAYNYFKMAGMRDEAAARARSAFEMRPGAGLGRAAAGGAAAEYLPVRPEDDDDDVGNGSAAAEERLKWPEDRA